MSIKARGPILTPTRGELAAEILDIEARLKASCRGRRGPKVSENLQEYAAAWRLIERMNPGRRISEDEVGKYLRGQQGLSQASALGRADYRRFMRSAAWRRVAEMELLQGRFLAGPFLRVVHEVVKGREHRCDVVSADGRWLETEPITNKKPTRRDLMRIFRLPGKKNCTAADLARYWPAIERLARKITAKPRKDPLTERKNNPLIPRDPNLAALERLAREIAEK